MSELHTIYYRWGSWSKVRFKQGVFLLNEMFAPMMLATKIQVDTLFIEWI